MLISSSVVAWSSKKQLVVTLSTTKAKFIAVASCACQSVWMHGISSKNLVMHGRSKHIDVRFHFLRDLTNDGVIILEYCGSKD